MNHLMMDGRKRQRKEKEEEGNLQKSKQKEEKKKRPRRRSLGISDLSDDLIEKALKFVGRGNFLFVAATSQQFYRVYERVCENENENDTTETTIPATTTKMKSALESVSRLQLARENGCPWDWRTCANAAGNGHLGALQWARENECPWDEDTCNSAARNGHLEVLQWARENGCPLGLVIFRIT